MPYNPRQPDNGGGVAAHKLPHPRNLAMAVLLALVALWALRHVFGTISVSAGTK